VATDVVQRTSSSSNHGEWVMSFRLVESGWDTELRVALEADCSLVRIICPFMKEKAATRLLHNLKPQALQVITRFSTFDFCEGVSDLAALQRFLDAGAQIRGVQNVHAKVYLIGAKRAIVTSANLTDSALFHNHEFGIIVEDDPIVRLCHQYFERMWKEAEPDLTAAKLEMMTNNVIRHSPNGPNVQMRPKPSDFGAKVRFPGNPLEIQKGSPIDAPDAFVKFLGEGNNRASRTKLIIDEVKDSGCHRACTYPTGKRPRQAQDGAIMYMGRLVKDRNDILIFGRAVAKTHRPGLDDATKKDKITCWWMKPWSHFVRVYSPQFLGGTLQNGISLKLLMDKLGVNSFASTQRNAVNGSGNLDPRKAYLQKPEVPLSEQGRKWLHAKLEAAFRVHGMLPAKEIAALDWPPIAPPMVEKA
jgi:HKD family nuclease